MPEIRNAHDRYDMDGAELHVLREPGHRRFSYGWPDVAKLLRLKESTVRRLATLDLFSPESIHSILSYRRERELQRLRARHTTGKAPMQATRCCQPDDGDDSPPELYWETTIRAYLCIRCKSHYGPVRTTLAEAEARAVQSAMEHHEGRLMRACEDLGITRHTLRRKLEKHGLYGRTSPPDELDHGDPDSHGNHSEDDLPRQLPPIETNDDEPDPDTPK